MEDTNDFDRMTDLRILRTICDEIEAGQAPGAVAESKADFRRLLDLCETEEYQGELWQYLKAHPRVTRISLLPTARRITRMISDQIDNLESMKAERPLTDEEEHRLRDNLFSLLKRVDSLVCWAAGTQRKKTGEDENLEKKR